MEEEKSFNKINRKVDVLVGGIFSLILTLGFFLLAVPDIGQKTIKIDRMYEVTSKIFLKKITLPIKSDYVLKIKYDFRVTSGEVVYFNDNELELRVSNKGKDIITRYYYIPKDIIKSDSNFLKIVFFPDYPKNIDIRIRNFLGLAEGGQIILTLKDSSLRGRNYLKLIIFSLIFYIFSFLLWISLNWGIKIFNLTYLQVIFNKTIGFLSIAIFYLIIGFVSLIGPYAIVVSPLYFIISLLIIIWLLEILLGFLTLFFCRASINIIPYKSQAYSILHREKFVLPSWLLSFGNWVKTSEFSSKCILMFIILLIGCAFFINSRFRWFAEELAKLAYFILFFGLTIKLIKLIKTGKDKI
ncbi:MAG: hypothetical protein ACTSWE_05020 [Promethearchaeota archaeon]